ncbi:sensor histidine kinase [Bacillus massiliglaciei]|uniref:sensor histidine kinase n=1 Tax=Bacillus massiliglaciei TaxID=1816693 RepID=UPI000DA62FC2|nr:ATP-binding protein [Bacillus massiliglaciei]
MKIRTKIQLYAGIFLFILLFLLSVLVSASFFWISLDREKEILEQQAELLEKSIGTLQPGQISSQQLEMYTPDDGFVRLYDESGKMLRSFADEEGLERIQGGMSQEEDFALNKQDGEYLLVYSLPFPEEGKAAGMIEMGQNIEAVFENLWTLAFILGGASLMMILVFILAGRRFAGLILRPISAMSETMSEIEKSGEFKKITLEEQSNDEIHKMGETFNRMMDKLEENHIVQQQFLSDASHELKTPITIIESYASILKRWGKDDPAVQEEAIETIQHESKRMKELTEYLLQSASNSLDNETLEETDIIAFCKRIANTFQSASGRKIKIESDRQSICLPIYRNKIEQILFILLDNAKKYSEKEIMIHLCKTEEYVRISVMDGGIGIPASELSRVFERFYRVDSSRTRATGGTGLGLSIAKSIADSIGINIAIESEEGKGTKAILTI